jgi:tryptophan halogenase
VVDVSLNPENGHLESLLLKSGERIEADFFIDCSGFSALLIEKSMQVKFQDWSQWLPCDRAVAVPSQNVAPPKPFTRSTALPAGWQWRIPLQHRTGNGYVYTSQAISDDQAAATLLANLEGEALAEPRVIPFRTGRRKTFWTKNCLAMGLAAGFLEPLESTAIHLVQQGIARLLALFPDKDFSAIEIDEYNRQMSATYEQIRDFLILHYKLTERDDSGLWLYCRDMAIPESLQCKMDLFAGKGRCFRYEDDLFSVTSWVAVMLGQGIQPAGYDEVVNSMSEQELDDVLNRMLEGIRTNVRKMPTQQDFLSFRTRQAQ